MTVRLRGRLVPTHSYYYREGGKRASPKWAKARYEMEGDSVTAYQYRVVVVAVRPRARQGQPLGGEAVRGMLGGAGGCVAVLIFTLTYHLGHDGVEGDLLSC